MALSIRSQKTEERASSSRSADRSRYRLYMESSPASVPCGQIFFKGDARLTPAFIDGHHIAQVLQSLHQGLIMLIAHQDSDGATAIGDILRIRMFGR